jgi:hypothetical protein
MILLVNQLREEISTTFSLSLNKRSYLAEIKPYIYMHNSPNGLVKFSIEKDGEVLFEFLFNSAAIKDIFNTTDNYIHGYLPIPCNVHLDKGQYVAKLEAEDYTFNTDAYIGWVKEWDQFFFEDLEPLNYPNSMRLTTYDSAYFKFS